MACGWATDVYAPVRHRHTLHLSQQHVALQHARGACFSACTAQALHYVRRVIEKGEMTGTETLFVLLDWEKAFDKVKHDKLI